MRALIAFYSRAGENYVNGRILELQVGNTEKLAKVIQNITKAELFKIEPFKAYPKDYSDCLFQVKQDQRREARPELKSWPENLALYEVIYLGYPNYWGTLPMPVFTFLEKYNMDGTVIKPFCTHEGSGLGKSVEDIKKVCPKAVVKTGLEIHGEPKAFERKKILCWLKEI